VQTEALRTMRGGTGAAAPGGAVGGAAAPAPAPAPIAAPAAVAAPTPAAPAAKATTPAQEALLWKAKNEGTTTQGMIHTGEVASIIGNITAASDQTMIATVKSQLRHWLAMKGYTDVESRLQGNDPRFWSLPGDIAQINTLTEDDVVRAQLADREAIIQAAQVKTGREEEGKKTLQEALGGIESGLGLAAETRGRVMGAAEEGFAAQLGGLEATRQFIEGLPALASARAEETLEEIDARRTEALNEFRDNTAQDLQIQRQSVDTNLQQQISQIEADARRRGMDPRTDRETQMRIKEARRAADGQLGTMATALGSSYNQHMSALRQSYDEMSTQASEFFADLQKGVEMGSAELLQRSDEARRMTDSLRIQSQLAAEQGYQMILNDASRLKLQGSALLADYLRDMSSFFFPIADYIDEIVHGRFLEEQERDVYAYGASRGLNLI